MKKSEIQGGKSHYFSKRYLHASRWTTYSLLIRCILEIEPSNILEIGVGNHLVADILKKIGYSVRTLDIDKSLNPDYNMDVRSAALLDLKNKFDLIIASQVLEHIEYSDFLKVVYNLSLITKKLILTLPYTSLNAKFYSFIIKFPLFKRKMIFQWTRKFYFKKLPHISNSSHYWEIGEKNYPLRKIKKDIINNGWIIQKNFFNQNNPYHYFFILTSKKNK